jgi:hypothetical protein
VTALTAEGSLLMFSRAARVGGTSSVTLRPATVRPFSVAPQEGVHMTEPLSAITPASRASLCASGSGGDLASVQVTHDDGSSLTVNITVWEYV